MAITSGSPLVIPFKTKTVILTHDRATVVLPTEARAAVRAPEEFEGSTVYFNKGLTVIGFYEFIKRQGLEAWFSYICQQLVSNGGRHEKQA